MRIRTRIGVVAAVVTLPQLVGLLWWDGSSRHQAAAMGLSGMLERAVHEQGASEACGADPEGWIEGATPRPPHEHGGSPPRERRGPKIRGDRPPPPRGVVPPSLQVHSDAAQVTVGGTAYDLTDQPVGERLTLSPSVWGNQVAVGIRTGWEGPCEVVTVHGTTVPGFLGSVLPAAPLWLGPLVILATVMWLAVAPPVNRIRRLTEAVRSGEHRVGSDGDDEIAELSRAFEEAAVALDAEARRREAREVALRDFVANTAHDVRIPLTVLRGHLAALESASDSDVLQRAMSEVHYLGALLDDLAAQARMESGGPFGDVDLGAIVQRVVSRHEPIARRKRVEVHHGVPEEPVVIQGDLTLVEQALSNLVYNAIHHHTGGHVAVTLDVEAQRFEVLVSDDGPGVPEEELHRLTERGYQGTAARGRDERGSGLGLAIVAKVAETHGWTFTLRNGEEGLEAMLTGEV